MNKINVKVLTQESSKDFVIKGLKTQDVEVIFCLRSKEISYDHKSFALPSKKDFFIIKPHSSPELLDKIQEAIHEGAFLAKADQSLILRSSGTYTKHVVVVGLGEVKGFRQKETLCLEAFRRGGAIAYKALATLKAKTAVLNLQHFDYLFAGQTEKITQAFLLGFKLASYKFEDHLSEKSKYSFETLHLVITQRPSQSAQQSKTVEDSLNHIVKQTFCITEGVEFARWLSDHPGNIINPETLAKQVQKKFKGTSVKVTVWDQARIKRERMGLLYGVGQGSAVESRLIIMEYKSKDVRGQAPVCFVGKGITFDSGGISIKPSQSMEEMKYDMCGSADVIGTLVALEKLQAPVHIIGIVAAAENMPGPSATKPGDIHYARNGTSVEVFNTDAEGRLALGDALCLAVEKKPQFIVDVATLTGAIIVALGAYHTGYFVRDKQLAEAINKALDATEENAWRLPLNEEHRKLMKGTHADLQNICDGKRGAGSTKGAAFLSYFVDDIPWAHFDIAGTAWNIGHLYPYCPKKGASALMVRTFCQLAINTFRPH